MTNIMLVFQSQNNDSYILLYMAQQLIYTMLYSEAYKQYYVGLMTIQLTNQLTILMLHNISRLFSVRSIILLFYILHSLSSSSIILQLGWSVRMGPVVHTSLLIYIISIHLLKSILFMFFTTSIILLLDSVSTLVLITIQLLSLYRSTELNQSERERLLLSIAL